MEQHVVDDARGQVEAFADLVRRQRPAPVAEIPHDGEHHREPFMNDYVDFMKKYQANPTDLSLITDYATYINKYNELSQSLY